MSKTDSAFTTIVEDEIDSKTGGIDLIARAILNRFATNVYAGTDQFRALVLTNARPVATVDNLKMHGINTEGTDWMNSVNVGDSTKAHWVCRCRILEKYSPHESLPVPENLADPNIDDATAISHYPYFITRYPLTEDDMPQLGDIVFVTFEAGPAGGNMYKGQILPEKYYSDGGVGSYGSAAGFAGPGGALGAGVHPSARAATDQTPEKIGTLTIVNRFDAVIGRPNQKIDPKSITLHWTAGGSVNGAIAAVAGENLSYHFIIDRDGTIHQLVRTTMRAWHDPATNSGIGISFVNLGFQEEYAGKKGSPPIDKWVDGPRTDGSAGKFEPYPEAQIAAGEKLVSELKKMYPSITKIWKHLETSSGIKKTKGDPGPDEVFPISRFR